MPVPNTMADLSNVAGDNYPVGSEPIGNQLDNYLRSHAALIRHPYSLASQSMASGSTVSVANANGESVQITGDATINSLGAGFVGCKRELRFSGEPTLNHSSNLQLPGALDISASAGMVLRFRCIAASTWVYTGGTYVQPMSAENITSGIFGVERGGTGVDEFPAGSYLRGDGTNALQARTPEQVRGDIGAAPTSTPVFQGPVSVQASGGNSRSVGLLDGDGNNVGGINMASNTLVQLYATDQVRIRPNGPGSSSGQMVLMSNGNMTVSGNVTAAGSMTATNVAATSDSRLKDDIIPAKPRAELLRLMHHRYKWKDTGKDGIGVIAQEVQKVAPEHVHESEDGTLSVDKAGLALEMVLALANALEAR